MFQQRPGNKDMDFCIFSHQIVRLEEILNARKLFIPVIALSQQENRQNMPIGQRNQLITQKYSIFILP